MFGQVSAGFEGLLEGLEVPSTGEALVWSFSFMDRFRARVLDAVGGFEADGAWHDSGATSMTAWLRMNVGLSSKEAGRTARTARRLRDLPVTMAAYRDGSLSGGQLEAVMACLTDKLIPEFAEAEAEMVPKLLPLPVTDVGRVMQAWVQAAKDALQDDQPDNDEGGLPERSLHHSRTLDGRGELSASLDPEANAIVDCALRVATTDDVEGEPERTPAHRRADALVEICRFFLDNQDTETGGRHRPHLNVFTDYEDLIDPTSTGGGGWLADGSLLDGRTIQRLACDAGFHRVVTAGGSSILDYGRKHQNVPTNLFNALVARDRGCRFPGCDRPAKWTEAHHILHWAKHNGPTAIGNLVLLCSRHHHLLHLPGWHIKLLPDATIEITRPNGQVLVDRPPGHLDRLFVTDTG